jgi:hypothetical protein
MSELSSNEPAVSYSKDILCERDVLSTERCDELIRTYDLYSRLSSQTDYCGNPVLHYWDLESVPAEQSRLHVASDAIYARLSLRGRNHIESLFLAMLPCGGHHPIHADNEAFEGEDWKPNHTPQRHYSTLLYLNSEFQGGDLCFPSLGIRIRPTRGLLIGFPSHHGFVHTVEPVTEGRRYSVACWFTTHDEFALPLRTVDNISETSGHDRSEDLNERR